VFIHLKWILNKFFLQYLKIFAFLKSKTNLNLKPTKMDKMEDDPFDLIADDISDEGEDTGRAALKYAFYNYNDTQKICAYVKAQFDASHG
jgi:hypothetical protein